MSKGDDVDPSLLSEVGRASAIQDLADQAKELSDRGKALEQTTISEMTKVNNTMKTQNKVLLYGVTLLLILNVYGAIRERLIISPKLEDINAVVQGPIATANVKLDELIVETDRLVEFVEQVEANQGSNSQETQAVFDAIFDIRTILCSHTTVLADPENCG